MAQRPSLPARASYWFGLRTRVRTPTGFELRLPRRLVPSRTRWSIACGHFEKGELAALPHVLDAAAPLLEFGGGTGCTALAASHCLDEPDIVVYEMDGRMVPVIEDNGRRNHVPLRVKHGALGYDDAPVVEQPSAWSVSSGLAQGRPRSELGVAPLVTLDEAAGELGWTWYNLVLDVEGVEADLVAREGQHLARHVASLLVDLTPGVLGRAACDQVLLRLTRLGFLEVFADGEVHGFLNSRRR